MKLVLFFPVLPGGLTKAPEFYFDKVHIDPIHDDTGKELSKQDWATYLNALRGRHSIVTASEHGEGEKARTGPSLELSLGLPDRRAETFRRLKGVVEVVAGTQEKFAVPDVVTASGKPIALTAAGLTITPVVRRAGDRDIVALRVTGDTERLLHWGPSTALEDFSYEHEETETIEGGTEPSIHVYPVDDPTTDVLAGLGLVITVFVPTARYRVPFDLEGVPLP